MKKVAVIANRKAGGGGVPRAIHGAERTLWGWEVDYFFPENPKKMMEVCGELSATDYEAAILVGGDGTLNQALPGIVKSQVPLCVYPAGTANDLAKELGITKDWDQVQYLLDHRQTDFIDLIEVNGIPFATVAGIGIGAILTHEFNTRRARSNRFNRIARLLKSEIYSYLSAKAILFRRDYYYDLRIQSEMFDEKVRSAAVFICNQSQLAGNLQVGLRTSNDDQRFSVLVVPECGTTRLLRGLMSMRAGKIPSDFISFSANRLSIQERTGRPIRVFGDGEILTESPRLDFNIVPKGLELYRVKGGSA